MKNTSRRTRIFCLLVFLTLSYVFITHASAQDTDSFKTWTFPYQVYTYPDNWHGPIETPADGYLGIRVKYTKPQNDPSFVLNVTVHWPEDENNCYSGSIPTPTATTFRNSDAETFVKSTASSYPTGFVEKIRVYGTVQPDTFIFDDKTPVPSGFLFIETYRYSNIDANKKIPYELTVFWVRAWPEADPEYNRVFDKPVDLGRKLAPFEISSHIGFISPRAFEYGGKWACVRDINDYFKFKVQKSGYYFITFSSTNDWGIDNGTYYCRPVVSGLQEETSSGSRYLSPEWWLKEKDRIGPYYFSTANTYYLDMQSQYSSHTTAPYECNASVLFTVQ